MQRQKWQGKKIIRQNKGQMMVEAKLNLMVTYALYFIKTPYLWGGSYPTGYDCSGFIQEVLSSVGFNPKGDQTAQGLFNSFRFKSEFVVKKGSLLFFGKSHDEITHVALAIDEHHMIEAGGGNSSTTNLDIASKQNAFIRIRPIKNRTDFIMGLYLTRKVLDVSRDQLN